MTDRETLVEIEKILSQDIAQGKITARGAICLGIVRAQLELPIHRVSDFGPEGT